MPKVTEEYMESKRQMIVDCAYKVCLRKPVEMVTISDVISETGMSQGAIYRYYNGLDEILADMITKMRTDYNIIESFERITKGGGKSLEDMVYEICKCLAKAMKDHLTDIQKINFDMGVIAINEPKRAAKIMAGIKGEGNLEYLGSVALPRLIEGAKKQGLKPKAPPQDFASFVSASYTGIEKYCIMSNCYSKDKKVKSDPDKLFKTLADSMILLLGGTIHG